MDNIQYISKERFISGMIDGYNICDILVFDNFKNFNSEKKYNYRFFHTKVCVQNSFDFCYTWLIEKIFPNLKELYLFSGYAIVLCRFENIKIYIRECYQNKFLYIKHNNTIEKIEDFKIKNKNKQDISLFLKNKNKYVLNIYKSQQKGNFTDLIFVDN